MMVSLSRKPFKTDLSKYFILSWVIVSLIVFLIVFAVFTMVYKNFMRSVATELDTIAQQSSFSIQTYVRLLHNSENSLKDSIATNFYTQKIHSAIKNYVDQDPDIYAVLVISSDKQVICAYPQNVGLKLRQHSVCSENKINISSAFYINGKLTVADCIPFDKGYILVSRIPVLILLKPLINIDYKSLNVFLLKKDNKLQDSLKKINQYEYKSYLKYVTKLSGNFNTQTHLVSYVQIPYTGRTLFVSVSKKEVYENFLKGILPFLLTFFLSFIILSIILLWAFYKLNLFDKLRLINISFIKASNDINALMIDKISFRSVLDKISDKLIENHYIDLCIFYFKEQNEMRVKSYRAKKECLECFESNILGHRICNRYFLDLAKNNLYPQMIDVRDSKELVEMNKYCKLRVVWYLPVLMDNKVIGSLIIASKNKFILQSTDTFDIMAQFLENFKNKLELIKIEKLQASTKNKALYLAYHDNLTGLTNRSFFVERLHQVVAKSYRTQTKVALFSLDLDGFKKVNDAFGHDMGDRLLKSVSLRLKYIVRKEDTLSRFGGDEFLILTDSFEKKEDLEELARRILNTIKKPFIINNQTISVGISIGIAYTIGKTTLTEEDYLKAADDLLYESKKTGRNKYTITGLS
jgi:diguanylate cyclase (GGDEF)-like protein